MPAFGAVPVCLPPTVPSELTPIWQRNVSIRATDGHPVAGRLVAYRAQDRILIMLWIGTAVAAVDDFPENPHIGSWVDDGMIDSEHGYAKIPPIPLCEWHRLGNTV